RMFPGHGAVVKDPEATLSKTLTHFEDLRAQAWALHDEGLDRAAITARMFPDPGRFASGRFNHANLVTQLLAHR
ncbi:MAG: hypothetical protein R3185_03660, partial [Candidatus Thermoplasmatota archaeon]|nr:hypothetical protein [Candidatus Thermoplasmatota archaeon]